MTKQQKVKHHFLPEVYLKGFAPENDDELFVLRKPYGNISRMHPAQMMYRKHLYTIKGFDNPQMIEDFYQEVENELSNVFEIFNELRRDPREYVALKQEISFHQLVKSVIAFQFWRSPKQEELAIKMSEKLPSIFCSLPNEAGQKIGLDSSFIDYLYQNRRDVSHRKLIQNMLLPLLTFRMYDDTFIDFSFFVAEKDGGHVLTCDNPVIYQDLDQLFCFKSFAFPLTKNIIIASSSFNNGFTVDKFNSQIVLQAEERVVGSNKDSLEYVKEYCEI
ncbi:hypothetical protein UB33_11040 [Photobacterium angustum]|uniref:DUF4238 domain-containing protein n=1 Tax=Photobacterium angustum TaxID=661 RepID=UPI0005EA164A|nr:DUF4238 domain-containing protein [Photobacterium angustum]KJG05894.1 hypothetical protein UB33_11040 [Photobacterium angustum]PSV92614.1 DUF4238 domain-containing protein [Photobacterium angustum]